jgi:antitoxin (DNA-binding transcriptional repressor) of toxin-antitoxin stability system
MDYGIAYAKNNLPKLIKAALRGETVRIVNRGADAVELVRMAPKGVPKGYGSMPGLTADLPPGWDSPAEKAKITALFEDV